MTVKLHGIYMVTIFLIAAGESPSKNPKNFSLIKVLSTPKSTKGRSFWNFDKNTENVYNEEEGSKIYPSQTFNYYSSSKYNAENNNYIPWVYNQTSSGFNPLPVNNYYYTSDQDNLKPSQSILQYQQIRPTSFGFSSKPSSYYIKTPIQTKGYETSASLKHKVLTPMLYYNSSGYKKTTRPRVHKPCVKNKYPTKEIVYSAYRRYYRSPYQHYIMAANEALRKKIPVQYNYFKAPETAPATVHPPSTAPKYYTTERMDDVHSTTSEDYITNETSSKRQSNYNESYDEADSSTQEEQIGDSSVRGYYGDRIYMSTKAPVQNSFFIIKRTSDKDDIETIFK